jgi:eukaryotic-like serine/threonine-protein kinase
MQGRDVDDSDLEATLEKELVRARLEVELFQKQRPVRLGRFEVVRCIGRGSLGVVYEARDTDHGGRVALKLLRRVDARTIAQFKHEFRVLSGITDPNLVALHELVSERDRWFVSMELIEGVPFDQWLRPEPGDAVDESRLRDALAQLVHAVTTIHRAGKLHRDLKPSNVLVTHEGRVVVLDYGLVSAAYAPKEGGPLVAPAELGPPRGVTVSDSSQWRQGGALRASPPVLIGTPGYMAPEQAAREPAQEASDWYAVGVMLFEVLAQRLPFEGSTRIVLRDKRVRAAPRLRELSPLVTHRLDALCRSLLERDPARRGGAAELEAWLGRRSSPPARAPLRQRTEPLPLEGRAPELQLLAAALEAARSRGALVWVSGVPGIGKTALLDAFAARVPAGTLVLRGRCHEEESIPLKLFDAIADALRAAFIDSDTTFPELTVNERSALLATFPVLGEMPGLAPADTAHAAQGGSSSQRSDSSFAARRMTASQGHRKRTKLESETERETLPMPEADLAQYANGVAPQAESGREPDVVDVRNELEVLRELAATADGRAAADGGVLAPPAPPSYASACAALSRLLASLARSRPIAILLDDLQWADEESARQFERVFGPPAAPPLLFVGAFRRDESGGVRWRVAAKGCSDTSPRLGGDARTQHIELDPLPEEPAIALAEALLRAHGVPATPELCRKLARDTRGIPFLMTELASQLQRPRRSSSAPRSSTGAIALASAIRRRVEALPAGARRLLAVLCVAPAGIALRTALQAAKLPVDEHAALTVLRGARLARSRGGRPLETLEPYHQRVRESVLQALTQDEQVEIAAQIVAAEAQTR